MHLNQEWQPFFDIAAKDISYPEKLAQYAAIARRRMDAERFEDFCQQHLAHLDEVAHAYFGGDRAREAVRIKVEALFPEHEWDQFTEHFWKELQVWREEDAAERAAASAKPKPSKKKSANSKK